MQSFKELAIIKTQGGVLPQLLLTRKWLEEINFTIGKLVSVTWGDSCLTLTTDTTVNNHSSVLIVESKLVRKKPRTQLLLNGLLLKKYGFKVGDRVGLHLAPNQIQITKINRFTTVKTA